MVLSFASRTLNLVIRVSNTTAAKLTQGSVSSGLFRLSLPMILGISSNLVAGLVEIWYLGMLGTKELAAYSFTFPVTSALMSISLGISIGLSSVLARAVGAGDQSRIKALATDGMLLITLIMASLSVIGLLSVKELYTAMGAGPDIQPIIFDYMSIWFLGATFMAVSAMGTNALRATGDSRISGTVMVSGAFLQMIFAPVFIFGFLGLPAMGVPGAAVAMALSRFLLFLATLYILNYREPLIDLAGVKLKRLVNSWKQILVVGVPAIATQMIVPVSGGIIVSLLAEFGHHTVAGFGIAARLEGLSVIPLFALSASIGPFVGQNWGAKAYHRANQAMKISFMWSVGWGLMVALVFYLFSQPIVSLFDDDLEVTRIAALYLFLVPVSYGAWGVLMMCSAIFNSLGKPLSSTTLSVIRMFILYVPMAFAGQALYGVAGIFGAACLSNILIAAGAFIWNRKTYSALDSDGSA